MKVDATTDEKLGKGVCVKTCPTEANLNDLTWW
jgi:NAD-dependent dihydropyrimidine dehydrogenase PreA subunit